MGTGTKTESVRGLKGVLAADSSICRIDGAAGRLHYRGYNIDDLAEQSSFEEVACLLLDGELPTSGQLEAFQERIASTVAVPGEVLDLIRTFPADAHPMGILRSAVSVLGVSDASGQVGDLDELRDDAVRLIGSLPTIVAAIGRIRAGQDPVAPDPDRSRASDFMRMLAGREPSEDERRSMDLILILHAEHGFNASTFASRVIAATLTDIHSAISGAIGALKGKLHGGANTEVLRTLQSIGSVDALADWVAEVRAQKGKFMGFGHAVYQTEDPRARHLKDMSARLAQSSDAPELYQLSVEMENLVTPLINRNCNVDFYSASVQHYLGISGDLFTCVFAASRIAGWCAHVLEQVSDNKIIRPSANYVGHDEREYLPVDSR